MTSAFQQFLQRQKKPWWREPWGENDPFESIGGSVRRQQDFDLANKLGTTLGSIGFAGMGPLQTEVPGTPIDGTTNEWRQQAAAQRLAQQQPTGGGMGIGASVAGLMQPTQEDILANLASMNDPSRYMMGQGDIEQQARAAASQQYDPIIAELQGAASTAQNRGARNKKELGQLFGALSRDLTGDIDDVEAIYRSAEKKQGGQYKQLEKDIEGEYNNSQKEQSDMMKRLGIQAAASDILPEQERDETYFKNVAKQEGQQAKESLGIERRADTEFTRQGASIAKSEGVSRQADLMQELRDILGAYDTQIRGNRAAKNNAYISAMGELQSQNQEQAQRAAQQEFDNYFKTIQMQSGMRKDQIDEMLAMQKLQGMSGGSSPVESPADIPGRAAFLGQGSGMSQQNVQNVYNSFNKALENSDLIKTGKFPGDMFGQQSKATPEAMAQRVVEEGRRNGLGPVQLNVLRTVALEYFGRG